MENVKLYRAKEIRVGAVGTSGDYYLDIVDGEGGQQTVAVGDFEYITKFMSKIILY
jgi:hypothetical protein